MVDHIFDKKEVAIPGPKGDVTPEALACQRASESARDEAQTARDGAESARDAAVAAGKVPDQTVSNLIRTPGSAVRTALYGGSCLVVGDSYAAGFRATNDEARWSTIVCRKMGWREYNYAIGGTGYELGGGNNFLGQAQKAKNDGVDPDVVLVAGGRNDGPTNIEAQATQLFTWLRSAWPAARLIAIPCFWGDYRPVDADGLTRAYEIKKAAGIVGNVQVIWDSWQWIYGQPYYCFKMPDGSLDMHPNDDGYKIMASRVLIALNGGPSAMDWAVTDLPPYNGATNINATADAIEGMVHIKGRFNAGSDIYTGWGFTRLDGPLCPGSDRYVVGWTNSGATLCLIKLAADGQCSINNIFGTPGPNVAFTDITYPMAVQ
ncbi:SGNH/GDSL hydrolase family protein [Bifidobacterium sp. ESL0784]|uniref:SGNH/GDSL hydrolase family protein n=1 Tax=Bifidobacterium sp. ESL0784 TaxID=2983231 RepID=UPI0023F92443|nr:SGNH/GDSL hydrolase family protein [Bifidobacterium sp. ESL0784]